MHQSGSNPREYSVEAESFQVAGNGKILQFINYLDAGKQRYETVAIFPVSRSVVYEVVLPPEE